MDEEPNSARAAIQSQSAASSSKLYLLHRVGHAQEDVLIEAAKLAPIWNPQLARLHEKELEKGNHNQVTLAVARKLIAYLLAVDRGERPFAAATEAAAAA